jgi:hypothetical protein
MEGRHGIAAGVGRVWPLGRGENDDGIWHRRRVESAPGGGCAEYSQIGGSSTTGRSIAWISKVCADHNPKPRMGVSAATATATSNDVNEKKDTSTTPLAR